MDNAAKALIMAGAILVAVAIVGLGVYFFSMSSDVVKNTGNTVDDMARVTNNAQINNYVGPKVRGTQVMELLRTINNFNEADAFPNDITVTIGTTPVTDLLAVANGTTGASATISQAGNYRVTTTSDNAGWINTVTITSNN